MFPQRCLCWKLLSEFRSLDAMESTFTGHALVLKNYANPTDQKFWSRLYTPTIEVTETSCLGFYTKLRRYSTFQVRLVWAESQSIYRTEGPKAKLMKVDIRLFSANYEVIYIFINLINVYIRISYWRLWLIYALVSTMPLPELVWLQVLLNIPVGTYQVQFALEYIGFPGIMGVLFNVTLEQNLCQHICKCACWKRINLAYKWLIACCSLCVHCHIRQL